MRRKTGHNTEGGLWRNSAHQGYKSEKHQARSERRDELKEAALDKITRNKESARLAERAEKLRKERAAVERDQAKREAREAAARAARKKREAAQAQRRVNLKAKRDAARAAKRGRR